MIPVGYQALPVAEELNVRQTAARLHLSGQKHWYPFAVLLRELPAERCWHGLQRAQLWPVPLAERVARAARR
jgi:hypothetical protein